MLGTDSCSGVSADVVPGGLVTAGTSLTIAATPSGCAAAQYDYWHKYPDHTWERLAGWVSTNPLSGVDTTGWAAGRHQFYVGVRAGAGGAAEQATYVTQEVAGPACTGVSLTVDPWRAGAGELITLTPAASGCVDPQYDYWHQVQPWTGPWERLAGWVATNPLTGFDTAGWPNGWHRFWVGVRSGDSGPIQASTHVDYLMECAGVSLQVEPAEPTTVGSAVTLTAAGVNCTGTQYDIWHMHPSQQWDRVLEWGASPTVILDTTGWAPGTHEFWAAIRSNDATSGNEGQIQVQHEFVLP